MASAWWDERLLGLDCETTGVNVESDRIVTLALVLCGGGDPTETRTWLLAPGVPIPPEATAVHGVTTERAEAEGVAPAEALAEASAVIAAHTGALVVMNARFDLTIMDRECRRHGLPGPSFGAVVDPSVLDKWLDRFRKSYPAGHDAETAKAAGVASSRTLTGMCAHYRASLDGAHDAAFDALAAVRLAYRMASSAQPVRRVRSPGDARELAQLRATWNAVRGNLDRLHKFQRGVALEERERFAEYKASIGEHDEAARIRAEVGWPVLEPRKAVA